MITLSVIKVKVKNPKYLLCRQNLDQVRELLSGARRDNNKETANEVKAIIEGKHMFSNRVPYTLSLDNVEVSDDLIYIYSTRHKLTAAETEHMIKMVRCAINAPNSLLILPDYIVISQTPPPDLPAVKKPARKRKKKDDKPSDSDKI